MKELFEIKPVDTRYYNEQLRDFLPERMVDIHTHIWLEPLANKPGRIRAQAWPARVAQNNSIEDLTAGYRLLFPDKTVIPLLFGHVLSSKDDFEADSAYVSRCAADFHCPALIWSSPEWSAEELETRIIEGGFIGNKSYLSLAKLYLPEKEIRIYDYFPPRQLEVLDRHSWILMLHIPRDGRLRDPVNLAQMLEIEDRYPRLQVIIAHVGRAYCLEDVGNAFKVLSKTRNMRFDISANTNAVVFRQLIEAVGPKRILFGSDLPIARMRMRRVCEQGNYVNIVPAGLYGDVSGDKHMREVSGIEADQLTFFMFEELKAFRQAAAETGLTRGDIEDVFYNNAAAMFAAARGSPQAPPQLQMIWPKDRLNRPPSVDVPADYELRTYGDGDAEAYIALMRAAGFDTWGPAQFQSVMQIALPDGLFFLIHRSTGLLAATAVATHNPCAGHPFGGELGWVAVHPDHRGKGLAMVVCAAATRRFLQADYTDIYLRTDDFRLPAIKTYWKLDWAPWEDTPEMRERWQTVRQKLNRPG